MVLLLIVVSLEVEFPHLGMANLLWTLNVFLILSYQQILMVEDPTVHRIPRPHLNLSHLSHPTHLLHPHRLHHPTPIHMFNLHFTPTLRHHISQLSLCHTLV